MKPIHTLRTLSALLPLLLVLSSPALVVAQDAKSNTPMAWPPKFMQSLPPDYVERARASLEAGTSRMSKLQASDPKDSIGWVRYGMASLILGQRTEDINRFFESDKFVVTANPKFGFSLFGVSYVRMYGLMNSASGRKWNRP